MGRKPSFLWRYAECLGKQFKCKFCEQLFPGGVVRLRAHLAGIKGRGIQVCGKVPKDVKDAALLASNESSKKSKTETSSSNSDGISSMSSDATCSIVVDNLLAKFFEMNGLPCCIVESQSFINLVNVLIKSGPGYVLPSCSALENQLIPSLRQEVEQYVSSTRQSWEEIGCTLVSDIWLNEEENKSFLSIMACSGKKAVLLNTFEIPNNNLTAAFLEVIVHHVIQDVGVENIVQYIGDDSPYTKLFSELLGSQCPHVFVTRCAVRESQSFFEEVIQKVEWVGNTFEVAKYLVDCLCKDDDLSALMRNYTGYKEHSSSYEMLESIFEVKEELVKLVQSAEWLALGYDQRENGNKATEIIASEEFWKHCGEVQMVLKPLFKILHLDETADSGFGCLYGLMKMMEEAIASLHNNNRVKFQKIWEIFLSKKGKIINETHKAAAYLNPSYMCNVTGQESREVEKGINYILQKLVAGADEVAFVEQAMHYRQTLSNPSERLKIIAAKTFSPGQWWNAFGDEFPVLKKYAIRILNQPVGRSSFNIISLSGFRANLVKQRGLVSDLEDLNVRINLVLMEKSCADSAKRKVINFEEFNRHKSTNESSDAVLVGSARHADEEEETRGLTIREELPGPKDLKLCFMTVIESLILTGQKVEGYQGHPIRVYLVDSDTDCVVQDGAPSTLTLTISVLDGDFNNEGSSDESRSREYFDNNDLSSEITPLVTGDLQLVLMRGMGILGDFSFNYSSRRTRSGKFRLAIKTDTGDFEGIRIFEGISNAFVVDDNEVTRTHHPASCEMHLPKDSAFSSIVGHMNDCGSLEQQMLIGDNSWSPGDWADLVWNHNQLQGSSRSKTASAIIAADSNSLQPASPAVTLFGVRVAGNSSGAEKSPAQHLSTTLQLSNTGDEKVMELQMRRGVDSNNNVNQQYNNNSTGEGIDKVEEYIKYRRSKLLEVSSDKSSFDFPVDSQLQRNSPEWVIIAIGVTAMIQMHFLPSRSYSITVADKVVLAASIVGVFSSITWMVFNMLVSRQTNVLRFTRWAAALRFILVISLAVSFAAATYTVLFD